MNVLDKFYTPETIAGKIISEHVKIVPNTCIDPTCGPGHLLKAVSKSFQNAKCIGIDKDGEAISKLIKLEPEWKLLNADIFSDESYEFAKSFSNEGNCCLLIMNPPFSMGNKKSYEVVFRNQKLSTSIAMAFILRSFDLFNPKEGGFVIVPESLLYSEVDEPARKLLTEHYSIKPLMELNRRTFRGANVGAVVIQIDTRKNLVSSVSNIQSIYQNVEINITRGGRAVHKALFLKDGIPFVHTTDLKKLKLKSHLGECPKVGTSLRSKKFDWAILIPRVSKPAKNNIVLICYDEPIELSDCVIALHSEKFENMHLIKLRILNNWDSFIEIYKGTGARYTTKKRLSDWLKEKLNVSTKQPHQTDYSQKTVLKYTSLELIN